MTARLYRYELPLLRPFPRAGKSAVMPAQGYIFTLDGKRFAEVSDTSLGPDQSPALIESQLRLALSHNGHYREDDCAQVRWALSSLHHNELCEASGTVLLNTLLDASDDDLVDQAMAQHTAGYRCFKIKIGGSAASREIARIAEMCAVLGKSISLRLDANRGLTLPVAVEFAKSLKRANIEYFEEPFADLADVEEFHRLTGIQVALDESILSPHFDKWCDHEAVSTFVLKPTRIGSLIDVLNIVDKARRSNKLCVFTSTFESSIGLMALAKMAALGQIRSVPMGLSTGSYFAADLLSPPLRTLRGQLVFARDYRVNLDYVRDITHDDKPL